VNVVDLVLVVAILVFAVTGWRRGFLYGLLSLGGFLVGGAVGLWVAPKLVGSWDDGIVKALTALVIVFFLATLGQVLVGMVGRRMHGAVTWKPAVVLNQSAGAVLSVMSLLLVAWFAANMFVHDNRTSLARDVRQSQVLGFVDNVVPLNPTVVTGEIQSMFDGTGFPDVFTGLGPEPVEKVGPPDKGIASRPAVVAAASETVKVLANDSKCGESLVGSGFAFAPNRVLTNAHVVAGSRSIEVVPGGVGRAYEAVLVYFDPDMDLAVLAVADLPVKPLQFASDEAERGDNLAVLGYPEDGSLTTTPARVRAIQDASGSDIYGEGNVIRQVISMRAEVRPGNSGGPVVDPAGDVVGVVFANSLDSADTGYAMTSEAIASAVTDGVAAVDFAGSGPCT